MPMSADWPFADPPDLPVRVSEDILNGTKRILHVQHLGEHYQVRWWFSDRRLGERLYGGEIPLSQVMTLDPTVRALATLPLGWTAWRITSHGRWYRTRYPNSKVQGAVRLLGLILMLTIGLPIALVMWSTYYGRIAMRKRRIVPTVTQAIERSVPIGTPLWQVVAFLHSPAMAALARELKLQPLDIDTFFKKGDQYYQGTLWSQAYPGGRMLKASTWTQGKPGSDQALTLLFFFDSDGRLVYYAIDWHVPK
jgi:hypothetical protein